MFLLFQPLFLEKISHEVNLQSNIFNAKMHTRVWSRKNPDETRSIHSNDTHTQQKIDGELNFGVIEDDTNDNVQHVHAVCWERKRSRGSYARWMMSTTTACRAREGIAACWILFLTFSTQSTISHKQNKRRTSALWFFLLVITRVH